jgi:hypothetical protein
MQAVLVAGLSSKLLSYFRCGLRGCGTRGCNEMPHMRRVMVV